MPRVRAVGSRLGLQISINFKEVFSPPPPPPAVFDITKVPGDFSSLAPLRTLDHFLFANLPLHRSSTDGAQRPSNIPKDMARLCVRRRGCGPTEEIYADEVKHFGIAYRPPGEGFF